MFSKGRLLKTKELGSESPVKGGVKDSARSRNKPTLLDFSNKTYSVERQLLVTKNVLDKLYESQGARPQTSKNKRSVTNIYTNKKSRVLSDIESSVHCNIPSSRAGRNQRAVVMSSRNPEEALNCIQVNSPQSVHFKTVPKYKVDPQALSFFDAHEIEQKRQNHQLTMKNVSLNL